MRQIQSIRLRIMKLEKKFFMFSILQFGAHFLNLFFAMKKNKKQNLTKILPRHSSKTRGIFLKCDFYKDIKHSEIESKALA